MSDFTVYEKMRAAERETRLRQFFKDKALETEKLKQQGVTHDRWGNSLLMRKTPDFGKLDYQIRCMQEIADEYRSRWDGIVPTLNIDDGFMV